jgi:hypothetical protein
MFKLMNSRSNKLTMNLTLKQFNLLIVLLSIVIFSCKKENIPPVIENQSFSIDENSPDNTIVGILVAEHDVNQTLTYEIISGIPENAFLIHKMTGEIKVNNSSLLDFETNPVFVLTVKVTVNGNDLSYSTANVTINVNDISIPIDNRLSSYPFNGDANDESGNDNHGTVNNAILTTDRFGNPNSAFEFDGIDDYIDFNTLLIPSDCSEFSISLWVYSVNDNPDVISSIFSQNPISPTGNFHIYEYQDSVKVFLGWSNGFIVHGLVNVCDISKNTWSNIIIVYKDNLMDVYINGELLKENCPTYNTESTFITKSMAGWDGFESDFFKGKIDDINIYSRILTEEEIQILYKE